MPLSPIENLIIGTGPAAIATAMAFRRNNVPFEVLDVGYDLEPDVQAQTEQLAGTEPRNWDPSILEKIFEPPESSATGIKRRLAFGSDFPYRRPALFTLQTQNCDVEMSHSLGGLGNVWGAAMLPYSDQMLESWPVPAADLKRSYANVLKYVPLSAERDDLNSSFPIYSDSPHVLKRSDQTNQFLQMLAQNRVQLNREGVQFGRARVAVGTSCTFCGQCIEGCVYGAIFNPRLLWRKMSGVKIHQGFYANEFKEKDDHVAVTALSVRGGGTQYFKAKRLFLATGHFATARIIASSFQRFNEKIKVADSQYFFFPLFSYGKTKEDIRFTLVDSFLEMNNKTVSDENVHFHVSGQSRLFERAVRLRAFAKRMYMLQGFLHSKESGHLEMTVRPPQNGHDEILISGVENSRAKAAAKKAQRILRRNFLRFGLIPPGLRIVRPGRSFHSGASFPMGGQNAFYSSDVLGRPAGLKRVHIMDSASFPNIPGSTIAFTIMANADRIVDQALRP